MTGDCRFGIDAISVHIPRHFIDLGTLATARGVDPAKYYNGLGGRRMAISDPFEDAVTMAAEAGRKALQRYGIDPADIGMVIVGSESGVDAAKPIASYVHGLLGLSPRCRTFDSKHACYGATAAMKLAGDWCARGGRRKALVVATDIARYDVGSPGEPTQGAGAVAMVVTCEPRVLALDPFPEAVFTEDVMDFWRPNYRSTAVVDGQFSLECYLKSLEATWDSYEAASGLGWDDYRHILFHVPFPKMAGKALARLHAREAARRNGDFPPFQAEFERLTQPGLWANVEVGNIYCGSLYLSLAGLLERHGAGLTGARLGFFSYGSGCCAEFYSGRVGQDASVWRDRIGIEEGLANRREADYGLYLAFRQQAEARARDGSFIEPDEPANGNVRFLGVKEHRRVYLAPVGLRNP